MIKYKGHQYREAAPAAVIDDAYWRHSALRFWIYAVVESSTGTDLPARSKQIRARTWHKMPEAVRLGVGDDADTQQRILKACSDGRCHYIAVEFVGWEPGQKRGAKDVQTVQNTLEWIERFRTRSAISGSRLIWAEIGSNVKKR